MLKNIAYTLFSIILFSSCVENDIPYPYIVGEIKEFKVIVKEKQDQTKTSEISAEIVLDEKIVKLQIDAKYDLERAVVSRMLLNDERVKSKIVITNQLGFWYPNDFIENSFADHTPYKTKKTDVDLRGTLEFTIRTYKDYVWKVETSVINAEGTF